MRIQSLLASAFAALFSGAALAAQLPTPLPPANSAPIVYVPPERLAAGAPSSFHVLNVFLPLGQMPAGGWPVVLTTGYGGGASAPPAAQLASTGASKPFWDLVNAGLAVVHYGTPGIGNNRGLWYPPGHPSGRYESFLPAHDNPEKSAEWALQWLKVQTSFPFDLTRVGLRGSSGGAVLALRTAAGPERARASGSAQVRASTRVAAILAIQPPTSAWALEQGPELTIPFPKHLEKMAQPFTAAATLSEVDPELQKGYSLMRECFASAEARANNAGQALCLVYADPVLRESDGSPATFALDATGFPIVHDRILQPTQHDSWFGYVFWKSLIELSPKSAAFHGANSIFAMRDVNALAAPNNLHTRTFAGSALGPRAARLGHDWLVARLRAPAPFLATSGAPSGGAEATVPLTRGCDPAVAGSLSFRGEAGGRVVLDVDAPAGSPVVLLCAAREFPGDPCGRVTPRGALLVDPRASIAPPRLARAGEPVELAVPAAWRTRGWLVQALVIERARTWLTDALELRAGE
jgi:hypothetical protein